MFFKGLASLMSIRNFEEYWAPTAFGYVWSLSVENQFYLALPILLLVVPRRARVPGMLALCVLNAFWRPGGEMWWLFRYDGLIYGLLLFELERAGHAAVFARCLPRTTAGRAGLLVCAGGMMLVAPLVLIHLHPLAWTFVNGAGFILVFAASRQMGVLLVPHRLQAAALWLGARSYSLYLCHIPVWTTVLELMNRAGLGSKHQIALRFVLALPLSLVAAHLTYRKLEVPLQAVDEPGHAPSGREAVAYCGSQAPGIQR